MEKNNVFWGVFQSPQKTFPGGHYYFVKKGTFSFCVDNQNRNVVIGKEVDKPRKNQYNDQCEQFLTYKACM